MCGRDLKGSKDRAHHRSHRVALLIGIAVMVAAALHLLPLWVAYLIFAVLWVGFLPYGPKFTDDLNRAPSCRIAQQMLPIKEFIARG